jgi:F0F1-type ATP synthase membrane subunit b/b'
MTIELNDWFEQILRCRQRTAAATVTRCMRKVAGIKKEQKRIEAEKKRREELERIMQEEEKRKEEEEKKVRETLPQSIKPGSTLVYFIDMLLAPLHLF